MKSYGIRLSLKMAFRPLAKLHGNFPVSLIWLEMEGLTHVPI